LAKSKDNEFWVFSYGSLMWSPGIDVVEATQASLHGHRRSFCIYSVHYRGTYCRPGLVLALRQGGSCQGMAFRVRPGAERETLRYLRDRELVNGVYREAHVPIRVQSEEGHREVTALTYVAETYHPSFIGAMTLNEQAAMIASASGYTGSNLEYVVNTVRHLRELNIRDTELERLFTILGPMAQRIANSHCTKSSGQAMTRKMSARPARCKSFRRDQLIRFNHRKIIGL
jgi:cation transport protein ChaC